jgi:hypothetical protein
MSQPQQDAPKKRTGRIFYLVAKLLSLFIIIGVIISATVVYFTSCDRVIIDTSFNPEHNKLLVRYNLQCAALAGSTNFVALNSVYQIHFVWFFEPFFTSDYDYEKQIHAEWTDGHNIKIKIPKDITVYRNQDVIDGIKIQYEN